MTVRIFPIFSLLLYITLSSSIAESQQATIVSFSLIRTDTGEVLRDGISSSTEITLSSLPTKNLSLRANTSPAIVRKVIFTLNGSRTGVDSAPPYALFGDDGGQYVPWTPTVGVSLISATGYERETNLPGPTVQLRLVVIGSAASTPLPSATGAAASSPTIAPSITPTIAPSFAPTIAPTIAPAGTPTARPSPTPVSGSRAELPIFPEAHGFGTSTTAGSGRHLGVPQTTVMRVTNLSDQGAGSLRSCIEARTPRVCVFEVAGIISLKTDLLLRSPYITVAGQTAPSPGILLRGASLRVMSHDVLIQHLQVRVGDNKTGPPPDQRDCISIGSPTEAVHNVVVDHVSLSWGVDENLSTGYPTTRDVTISNSIIAESLYRSLHSEGPHGMGFLVGDDSKNITAFRNIFAHNHDRNPRVKAGAHLEFISNIVYGWGGSSSWNQANPTDSTSSAKATLLSMVGNFYRPSPTSPYFASVNPAGLSRGTRIFVSGNIGPTRTNPSAPEWDFAFTTPATQRSATAPFTGSNTPPLFYDDVLNVVLSTAGSRRQDSNRIDSRIIADVSNSTGGIKDCVSGCSRAAGGYPSMAAAVRTLQIPSQPHRDDNGNGYTNLEEWLQAYAAGVE